MPFQRDEILTVPEAAAELRCSKAHVYRAINGHVRNITPLPSIAMGRRKLIRRSALEHWKAENERALGGAMMASPKIHAADA